MRAPVPSKTRNTTFDTKVRFFADVHLEGAGALYEC